MAGPAPGINNVYYLDVNPIFSFADSVVQQITKKGLFQSHCEGKVKLQDFQGDNCNEGDERCWSRLYDFSRTFGCVLRDMVLVATGGGHKVDPQFGKQAKGRNRDNYTKISDDWGTYTNKMQKTESFTTDARAQELVANYDRMNPHFFIEDFIKTFRRNNKNKMENMEYDHRVYVIQHRESEPEYIHQIDTYANISLKETEMYKFEGIDKKRIRIEVKVKTYTKMSDVKVEESERFQYDQLCTFNDDSIKRKKNREKKYYAGENEG